MLRNKVICISLVIFLIHILLSNSSQAQLANSPWPMRGHDERHTGRSNFVGAQVGNLQWKFKAVTTVQSSPAIGLDGTIYIGSGRFTHKNLYALNPEGTLKWKFETDSNVPSSPAIAIDGTVYIGSLDGYLYAIKFDGTLKWKIRVGDASSSPAIGSDGVIYIGQETGFLYAINSDGTLRWRFLTNNTIYNSSPAIGSDGTIYVGSLDNYLYAINHDGTLKWKFETGSTIYSSPAVNSDGTIYIGSSDKYLYSVNPDGTLKWKFQVGNVIYSSPAIGLDGTIYVGSHDNYLYSINDDGTLKWKFKTGDHVLSSPAISADGTVYIGSNDSYLYAINHDGTLKWKFKTISDIYSSPAIGSDGTIYVGGEDGYVYAVGEVSGPSIVLSDTSLYFGQVRVGDSKVLTLTIFNTGNAALSVTGVISSSGEFIPSPTSFIVLSDSSQELTVTFTPLTDEIKLATLTIRSNDPIRPELVVSIKGNISLTNLRLYLCNPIIDFVSRLPDLCDVPETSGNSYEWQFISQRTAMFWDDYKLPFDISGKQFKLHINCAETSNLSQVFFSVGIYFGDKEVFSKNFYVSGSSYNPYPSPFIFTSDTVVSAKAGEEVILAIGNAPILGLGSVQWGSGIDSYIEIPGMAVTSVHEVEEKLVTENFTLDQNYPNPFNPITEIRFALPKSEKVVLIIYDILGRTVKTLLDKHLPAGVHSVQWNGRDDFGRQVATGIYLYRLKAGDYDKIRKMILMQ